MAEHCQSRYVERVGEAAPLDTSRKHVTTLQLYRQLLLMPSPSRVERLRARVAAWWDRTQLRVRIS